MKYITIFGSIGVNIGDDLMNRVICLASHKSNCIPQVASVNPKETNRVYSEVTFSSSARNIHTWLPAIKKSSLVVVGGGTLIQNDFRGHISRILLYTVVAILISHFIYKKKVVALGLGINKLNRVNAILARAYRYCEAIYVRDEQSLINSKSLSLKNVQKLPDIGLGLQTDGIPEGTHNHSGIDSRYICISLVRENLETISLSAGRALMTAAQRNGFHVYAVCMDTRDSEEKSIYKVLLEEFAGNLAIFEPQSPYDLLPLLSNSTLNIGMRLHFAVISLLCKQNPVVISRETKTEWIQEIFPNSKRIDAFSNNLSKVLECAVNESIMISNRFTPKDLEQLEICRNAVNNHLYSTIANA